MTDTELARKQDELERLLNDPTIPMQPALVWDLIDEIASHLPRPHHTALSATCPIR